MSNPAIETYKSTSFEAAPPLKILRMLFAGALRFLEQASAVDPREDGATFSDRVGRVDAIVAELRCSLHPEHDPVLAERLEQLYVFVESELGRALVERSREPLEGAARVLTTLKDAWDRLEVAGDEKRLAG